MTDDFGKLLCSDDPAAAGHLSIDDQRRLIAVFTRWLQARKPGWHVLPPVSIYNAAGDERLRFSVRREDVFIGVFGSPLQVLLKIGDDTLTNAFILYMRGEGRRLLHGGLGPD